MEMASQNFFTIYKLVYSNQPDAQSTGSILIKKATNLGLLIHKIFVLIVNLLFLVILNDIYDSVYSRVY